MALMTQGCAGCLVLTPERDCCSRSVRRAVPVRQNILLTPYSSSISDLMATLVCGTLRAAVVCSRCERRCCDSVPTQTLVGTLREFPASRSDSSILGLRCIIRLDLRGTDAGGDPTCIPTNFEWPPRDSVDVCVTGVLSLRVALTMESDSRAFLTILPLLRRQCTWVHGDEYTAPDDDPARRAFTGSRGTPVQSAFNMVVVSHWKNVAPSGRVQSTSRLFEF